jgi:hypothetical protein
MDRALEAADEDWAAFMFRAVVNVAKRKEFFYGDDLERYRQQHNGPSTHENRALGPLMLQARRSLICEPTDRWVCSSQSINHRRPMRVWRSLVHVAPSHR